MAVTRATRRLVVPPFMLFALLPLQAAPWIQQDRWLVLGPIENPGSDCNDEQIAGGDLESNPTPGHDLARECPWPGDDWGQGIDFVPGARTTWTELAALGMGPGDTVDLNFYAGALGLKDDFVKGVAVVYAINRTPSPIDVEVCWWSEDPTQVWINDRLVARIRDCQLFSFCDCLALRPATLVPGTNRIAIAVWGGTGAWDFRLRLLRPDGRAIDDSADPEVAFSVHPDGDC